MTVQKLAFPTTHVRSQVSEAEWQTRVALAACYRLVATHGWHDNVYNHISASVPGEQNAYLLNPYGMAYEEMTASCLVKVDLEGNILFNPDDTYGVNISGFIIHGAIHEGRPDLECVIHTHTIAGMAVSAMKCGLLPLNQSAMRFATVAYHDFEGIAVDKDECSRLVRDMGDAEVMILRNHGLLAAGRSIPEAFNNLYRLERACQVQVQALSSGTELNVPTPEMVARTSAQYSRNPAAERNGKSSPLGMLEWPALLRTLDRRDPSYKS